MACERASGLIAARNSENLLAIYFSFTAKLLKMLAIQPISNRHISANIAHRWLCEQAAQPVESNTPLASLGETQLLDFTHAHQRAHLRDGDGIQLRQSRGGGQALMNQNRIDAFEV